MKKFVLTGIVLLCTVFAKGQLTLGDIVEKEKSSVDSIVQTSVERWIEAVEYFLAENKEEQMNSFPRNEEERVSFWKRWNERYDNNKTFFAFMCNDPDDDIFLRYPSGKKRNLLPMVTLNFTNKASGKTTTVKKNIRDLQRYLSKVKYKVNHVDAEKVQVFLVDQAIRKKGRDECAEFVYYTEHVYAIADYVVSNGVYEQVSQTNDSFNIIRGKSYWELNRDEEELLKKDKVVVILGNANLNVYYE